MHVGCMTHEGAASWIILGGVRPRRIRVSREVACMARGYLGTRKTDGAERLDAPSWDLGGHSDYSLHSS